MHSRTQITIERALQRRAHERATELGISFAEYVRRIIANDLGHVPRRQHVSAVFDIVTGGPESDVARDKDRMIADAVLREHRCKAGKRADAKSGGHRRKTSR